MEKISIALVGAGSMGGALLRGWVTAGCLNGSASAIYDPHPSDPLLDLCNQHGLHLNPEPLPGTPDAFVFAVKPQLAPSVLPSFSAQARESAVVSVMAGLSIDSIKGLLGGADRIIRTMPNLPAAIGEGVSGLMAAPGATQKDKAVADALMSVAGKTLWVETEAMLDSVTAISGSGPAYFFLLAEALCDAAQAQGFSKSDAILLAEQTLIGAGAFLSADQRHADELRKAVTSPGGTTEAALTSFEADGLRDIVNRAARAAFTRARKLSD